MKTFSKNLFVVICLFISTRSLCQIEHALQNYISTYLKVDTSYNEVKIDDKFFTITIFSDKFDDHLEAFKKPEFGWDDESPKTIVIYDNSLKVVYVKKFSARKPSLLKLNGDLKKEGKLYLNWLEYSGGSGHNLETNLVYLENGKIEIEPVFESCNFDHLFFNKNDTEILALKGIWSDEKDENGELIEFPLSQHKYKVILYKFEENGYYSENELGITANKYLGLEDKKPLFKSLRILFKKEAFIPEKMNASEYLFFDNFEGLVY